MANPPVIKIRVSLKGRPVGSYSFMKEIITVGRDPGADISLDNASISREHLKFEFGPSGYYSVVDLGSANGTLLNEEPVERSYVFNGDVVRIGKHALWIELEKDRRAAEAEERQPQRISPDQLSGTMVLSTNDLQRVMDASKTAEASTPQRGASSAGAQTAEIGRSLWSSKRVRGFVTMAAVAAFLIGTAVGAGAAWVLLRP